MSYSIFFFFSSRRRHTRCYRDWSSDVCSSDLADRLAVDVEGHQQPFDQQRKNAPKLRAIAVGIGEQQRDIAIEHGAAGAVLARRGGVPDPRRLLAGDRVPAEMISRRTETTWGAVFLQQADPRRVAPAQLQRSIHEPLQNASRRGSQLLRQGKQGLVLSLVIRRARRPPLQFLGTQHRFQRDRGARTMLQGVHKFRLPSRRSYIRSHGY